MQLKGMLCWKSRQFSGMLGLTLCRDSTQAFEGPPAPKQSQEHDNEREKEGPLKKITGVQSQSCLQELLRQVTYA